MNDQQIHDFVISTTKETAALWEHSKSAHKRIDENDKVTSGIHKLSASIAGMTAEMKGIAERMEESNERMTVSIDNIIKGQRAQGERIGALENTLVALSKLPDVIEKLGAKVETIEKEPAQKWKDLAKQIVSLVVAAVFGVIVSKFM